MNLVHTDFARALADLWSRDGIVVDAPDTLAAEVSAFFARGDSGARAAAELLSRSGVRAQWNDVLRHRRSDVLAERIASHVRGPLVDVLAGDGSVCRALYQFGIRDLSATERAGDYSDSVLPHAVACRPFAEGLDFREFGAQTALLSTVLHHESEPIQLLDALAVSGISRWIVIENCVTPQFSRAFHRFADEFFNRCLNEFGLQCVEQHRTLEQWSEMLSAYGTLSVIDASFIVPGIPFPYALMVVDR